MAVPAKKPSGSKSKEERFAPLTDATPTSMGERKYDIVLFGSTGFTGRLAALYVAKTYGSSDLRFAISGRNQKKLERIREEMVKESGNEGLKDLDILIADTSDEASLEALVSNTKVIVTSVGPFAKYGTALVKYCVAYGTSYVDTTGEVAWVRDVIHYYSEQAKTTGAKVINLCGNDCIPWDMCAMLLSEKLKEKSEHSDEELKSVEFLNLLSGGFSGGTLATLVYSLTGPKATRYDFDPLYTMPDGSKSSSKTKSKISSSMGYSKDGKTWYGFNPLSPANMDCVLRSNALLNYGSRITYKEQMTQNSFPEALNGFLGLLLTGVVVLNPSLRNLALNLGVLPSPGEGPSQKTLDGGFLRVKGYATGTKGTKVEGWAYWPRDPGYVDTARMVVESGLCLALEPEKCPDVGGGIWSPAYGLGHALKDRLAKGGTEWHF